MAGDGGDLSPDVSSNDMEALRKRIKSIQENGLATPAQKYFDVVMSKSPQQLMTEFFRTGDQMVAQAMQDAVAALLGKLPPFEFDAQVSTTGDKLAALMLQLQMTGYLLRNAEYVMKLRQILQIKSRSIDEYRATFNRLDLDQSGYIEVGEVEQLFREVYGDDVPQVEVSALLLLFDKDGDGKVSWEEFTQALGAIESPTDGALPRALLGGVEAETIEAPAPKLSGTLKVTLDDGTEVEMDADAYMESLKAEATTLREELGQIEEQKRQDQISISGSLSAYIASLPEAQLKVLTSGISEDVVGAMRQLVTYILRAPSGDGPLDKDAMVTLEQAKMQQLCLYQLVLGYRLREAEATGEASDAIGR